MKYSEFITAIEDIYTPYTSDILKKLTIKYIKERWQESELDGILAMITVKHDPKYKTPPSPATFEECFLRSSAKSTDAEALHWWKLLNDNVNSYRDCMISDVRVQVAIEMMGGWVNFCQRLLRDENGKDLDVWAQKRFVELFKMYSEIPPAEDLKILTGLSNDEDYNRRKKKMIFIGDKNSCLQALEYRESVIKAIGVEEMATGIKQKTDALVNL